MKVIEIFKIQALNAFICFMIGFIYMQFMGQSGEARSIGSIAIIMYSILAYVANFCYFLVLIKKYILLGFFSFVLFPFIISTYFMVNFHERFVTYMDNILYFIVYFNIFLGCIFFIRNFRYFDKVK